MPTLSMIAPSDIEKGKIIKAYDGTSMVDVCVPNAVKKGEQFTGIVVGPGASDATTVPMGNDEAQVVKASPVTPPSYPANVPTNSNPQSGVTLNVITKNNEGPKKDVCMAVAGMVCGIIGLFVFGVVLGPLAIIFSSVALSRINNKPEEFGGKCQANAGLVLGIIDIVVWVIVLILITS